MTFTVTYRVNCGQYEPFTNTLTRCTDVSMLAGWTRFTRGGKKWAIPDCNIICIVEE